MIWITCRAVISMVLSNVSYQGSMPFRLIVMQ